MECSCGELQLQKAYGLFCVTSEEGPCVHVVLFGLFWKSMRKGTFSSSNSVISEESNYYVLPVAQLRVVKLGLLKGEHFEFIRRTHIYLIYNYYVDKALRTYHVQTLYCSACPLSRVSMKRATATVTVACSDFITLYFLRFFSVLSFRAKR